LRLELPAVPGSVPEARRALADFAGGHGIDLQRLKVAVSEAVTNAVEHAYAEGAPGEVVVSAVFSQNELQVSVADEGNGMGSRPRRRGLGLGLLLITSLADRVEIKGRGPGVVVMMAFAA
jgi:serine/threonine-protein kinase RsbW